MTWTEIVSISTVTEPTSPKEPHTDLAERLSSTAFLFATSACSLTLWWQWSEKNHRDNEDAKVAQRIKPNRWR